MSRAEGVGAPAIPSSSGACGIIRGFGGVRRAGGAGMGSEDREHRDEALDRVVDGTTWRRFCRTLEEAGQVVLGEA